VDGSSTIPQPIITASSDGASTTLINPEFTQWQLQDQIVLSALISSLSEKVIAHVVRCTTSRDLWATLERMFTAQSQARLMQIHYQLSTLRKGSTSISDFFHTFTGLADTLAAIDQPLPEFQLVSFLLAGLGPEYDSFVTSVQQRTEPITLDYLYGHLLNHEIRLEQSQAPVSLETASANFVSRGTFPVVVEEDAINPPHLMVVVNPPLHHSDLIVAGDEAEILPMMLAQFVKCAIVLVMWLFIVITASTTVTTVRNLLLCKPILVLNRLLLIQIGTLTQVQPTISHQILQISMFTLRNI
jgi:hypothetical protein